MNKNNIIARQLNKDDADALYALLQSRYNQLKKGKHNRSETIVNEQFERFMSKYMYFEWQELGLPHPDYPGRSYGVFIDGKLIAAFSQQLGTRRVRTYHFGNLVTDPEINLYYDVSTNGIAQAFDMAVEDAEFHGYNSFYWLTAVKGWRHREESWYKASRTFKRYNVYIENVILPNEKPKFSYEWIIMGEEYHNVTVAIKHAKLKPHLLHEKFQSAGLLKYDYVPLQEQSIAGPISFLPETTGEPQNMEIEKTKTEFVCREITYEEIMKYENYFLDNLLPLSNDYYAEMPNFENVEWHFYVAEHNGEPVSFTGLGLQPDINRIYHRSSMTMPGKDKMGGWSTVWNYKINEIKRNGWSKDDTVHYVLTKHEDKRYQKRGWDVYTTKNVVIDGIEFEQTIWYKKWKDLIEHPKPHVINNMD
jgi:hypothetical protein